MVPQALPDALPELPGLQITTGGLRPYLQAGDRRWRLLVYPRPPDDSALARAVRSLEEEAKLAGDGVIPLVASATLPERLRRELERRGISYVDGGGVLHVVAPGVILHIDQLGARPHKKATGKSLGATTVRAVQVLLDADTRPWYVAELAAEANISLGQAHNLWELLQRAGLAATQGSGRGTRRVIRDRRLLLNWLAAQRAARRVHEQMTCALYAPGLAQLCAKATRALDVAGISHAWTAAAAAALQDAGPSTVPRAVLRVAPDYQLADVLKELGAEHTDRGANLVLWRDVGQVGTHGSFRLNEARRPTEGATSDTKDPGNTPNRFQAPDVPLAPPVRVYLDLLGDRRGEDTAAHYREAVLGY
jgi:hypothetical protein